VTSVDGSCFEGESIWGLWKSPESIYIIRLVIFQDADIRSGFRTGEESPDTVGQDSFRKGGQVCVSRSDG
jgi:hypothetical protein